MSNSEFFNRPLIIKAYSTYTISGILIGLNPGNIITIKNNNGETLNLVENGPFTFSIPLYTGYNYQISVVNNPPGQTSIVNYSSGVIDASDVTNVQVVCGNLTSYYYVGGTLSGMTIGNSIVLQNNSEQITIDTNGPFQFSTPYINGSSYNVIIKIPSSGQNCVVNYGSGIINGSNINNVQVVCSNITNMYYVGGTINGLTNGNSITLLNTNNSNLQQQTFSSNGTFQFTVPYIDGSPYDVTIVTPSPGQTCVVTFGSGTINGANITTVVITCTTMYYVGGTINGLTNGNSITLLNTSNSNLQQQTFSSNGAFQFSVPYIDGSPYDVTIVTPSPGQTCVVTFGSGTINGANITTVVITCTTNMYYVGGTINGLTNGNSITLLNTSNSNLQQQTFSSNGTFQFTVPYIDGSPYDVTIVTPSPGQTCVVTFGSGTINGANITTVVVTCTTMYYVGGTINGLTNGNSITLLNTSNSNLQQQTFSSNGTFQFTVPYIDGSPYDVTIVTPSPGQTCVVTFGSGTINGANITTVVVTCTTNMYYVGGTINGLTNGNSITLLNTSNSNLQQQTFSSNGAFQFTVPYIDGSPYDVTIVTPSPGQTCVVTFGSGTINGANITNILISCSNTLYQISGTISGLNVINNISIINTINNDTTNAINNTSFAFSNLLANNSSYSISVNNLPSGLTYNVVNGIGTINNANVTNIQINFTPINYSLSGVVNNLLAGNNIILENTDNNDLVTVYSNSPNFTFPQTLLYGDNYNIIVNTNPLYQTATITNAIGTISTNVNNITVNCSYATYTIGGTVYDFIPNDNFNLINTVNSDTLTITNTGNFQFPTALVYGSNYNVIGTAILPNTNNIIVVNGVGTVNSNVNNIKVYELTNQYSLGGNIIGLLVGNTVTISVSVTPPSLPNNLGQSIIFTSTVTSGDTIAAPYQFANYLNAGQTYTVSVSSVSGQNVTITNSTGVISNNVTNVNITFTTIITVDGFTSNGGLIMDSNNILYGVTASGGTNNQGALYKYDLNTSTESLIYSFKGVSNAIQDGINPIGNVAIDSSGNIYGVTTAGGSLNQNLNADKGIIYKIDPSGNETILHVFGQESNNGFGPNGGLIIDSAGNIYGTTSGGGTYNGGVLFKYNSTNGFSILYSFNPTYSIINNFTLGYDPFGRLMLNNNIIYGVTSKGSLNGVGCVYTYNLSTNQIVDIYYVSGTRSNDGLLIDGSGNVYGTQTSGILYKLTNNSNVYTPSFIFNSPPSGVNFDGGVIQDSSGNYYGVSSKSNSSNNGFVYKITPNGIFTIIYNFTNNPDGSVPFSQLVIDVNNNLYGTTRLGGIQSGGTIYKIELNNSNQESILHSFTGIYGP